MSKSMNTNRLLELAEELKALLDEYEIDSMMFTLGIRVTPKYYRAIKENFSERHAVDMIVGTAKDDWTINLICSAIEPSDDFL